MSPLKLLDCIEKRNTPALLSYVEGIKLVYKCPLCRTEYLDSLLGITPRYTCCQAAIRKSVRRILKVVGYQDDNDTLQELLTPIVPKCQT